MGILIRERKKVYNNLNSYKNTSHINPSPTHAKISIPSSAKSVALASTTTKVDNGKSYECSYEFKQKRRGESVKGWRGS